MTVFAFIVGLVFGAIAAYLSLVKTLIATGIHKGISMSVEEPDRFTELQMLYIKIKLQDTIKVMEKK